MSKKMLHESLSPTAEEMRATDYNTTSGLPVIDESPPALSSLLRDGREKRGLKQKDLAKNIGVTPTIINRLEAGTTKRPSRKVLQKIAPYTGVGYSTLLYICGYSSDMEQERFYKMNGEEEIDYTKIVSHIYQVDATLLEAMEGINRISYENALILKKLIQIMKSAAEIETDCNIEKKQFGIWTIIFKSAMTFLSDQINTLNKILYSITT